MTNVELPTYKPKDFASDQEVRWCPGCGDYAILAAVRKAMTTISKLKENIVFVSGIGCSSRFPYYMGTYGLHSIHGRAPAIATGVKCANPDLDVWLVTGDGDGLSIGGNHLMHLIRRNVNIKVLLFNNRIYGLTKGQYSPTSLSGHRTKSTPLGSIDYPISPIQFAMGVESTFVARCTDVNKAGMNLMPDVLAAAAAHQGCAFIEIYQDCNVFNHQAFFYATEKDTGRETTIHVEHGKPLIFGAARDKGIRLNGLHPEVVSLEDVREDDLLFHDETDPAVGFLLSQMSREDGLPEPMGILHRTQRLPYDELLERQAADATEKRGVGDLAKLVDTGSTWTVG